MYRQAGDEIQGRGLDGMDAQLVSGGNGTIGMAMS